MDKYLKFASREEAESILFDKIEGGLLPKLDFVADVVGLVYKPTGKMLKSVEGEYPETKPVAGWHVNVRGPDADKFPDYEVVVNTPSRTWF